MEPPVARHVDAASVLCAFEWPWYPHAFLVGEALCVMPTARVARCLLQHCLVIQRSRGHNGLPADAHGIVLSAAQALRRSEERTSELQSRGHLVCRLLLEKKKDTWSDCLDNDIGRS